MAKAEDEKASVIVGYPAEGQAHALFGHGLALAQRHVVYE